MRILLSAVLVLFLLILGVLFFGSNRTRLNLEGEVKVVGDQTPVKVRLENTHGVRRVKVELEQGGKRFVMHEQTWPSRRLFFFGRHEAPVAVATVVGKSKAQGIANGKARLVVSAVSNDFRGAEDAVGFDVDINPEPPRVAADGLQHYIHQGGAELVTFQVSGYWTEAGVRCGKYTFGSHPMPGAAPGTGRRFSLFAYPWDLDDDVECVVYARNPSGAEATGKFWQKLFPTKRRVRDLEIKDSFLEKVVNEIDPQGQGTLIERFLKINGPMRKANNERLASLRLKSEEKQLWDGPFKQLRRSKVESLFADTRNYVYNGKKVDQQTHLGFDLSVTRNVPVAAGNDGRVVLAERLGIYGNCVVIDHGYMLQSIYAHLSAINVKEGAMVKKGDIIGNSGATGLAGGDHLHYGVQLEGVQINPTEWWDEHWMEDRVMVKLR